MISKDEFLSRLRELEEIEQADEQLDNALRRVAPSDFTGFSRPELVNEKVNSLIDDMEDKYEYISWWLWDAPDKGRASDDKCTVWTKDETEKWVIKTPEDLYDYLYECAEEETDEEEDVIEYLIEKSCRRAQMDGVRFAINTILEVRHANQKSNNEGAEEREALMRYLSEKISNEYAIKTGIFVERYANEDIKLFSNEEE